MIKCAETIVTIRYETTPTTRNDMGSIVINPATKKKLAEAMREPLSGRPQPHLTAMTTPSTHRLPLLPATRRYKSKKYKKIQLTCRTIVILLQ